MTEHLAWLAALCGPGGIAGSGPALLLGLLAAGAAGGVAHCAAMCGPFVLGQVSDRLARVPLEQLRESARLSRALLLPYHSGRLTTYAALGALAGQAGTASGAGIVPGALPAFLLAFAAVLFLCHALARLAPGLRRVLPVLERAPPAWTRGVRRLATRVDRSRPGGGFLLGAALGFLPCGFLYAAIAAAAAAGGATSGALAMLAFGLGTVPGLVIVGVAGHAAGRAWHRGIAVAAPLIMLANAAMLGAMACQRFAALA
jgi:hypothetical protein